MDAKISNILNGEVVDIAVLWLVRVLGVVDGFSPGLYSTSQSQF